MTVIEGISDLEWSGITERSVFIRLLPQKLITNGFTFNDVREAIVASNLSVPTGDITISNEILPVRINSTLTSIEDIKNVKLFSKEGEYTAKTLGEVAEVTDESKYTNNITRINGKEGVSFSIIPEGGADVVGIIDQVKKEMDSLAIPEDYKVEILHDQSIEINQSVHSMLREVF